MGIRFTGACCYRRRWQGWSHACKHWLSPEAHLHIPPPKNAYCQLPRQPSRACRCVCAALGNPITPSRLSPSSQYDLHKAGEVALSRPIFSSVRRFFQPRPVISLPFITICLDIYDQSAATMRIACLQVCLGLRFSPTRPWALLMRDK